MMFRSKLLSYLLLLGVVSLWACSDSVPSSYQPSYPDYQSSGGPAADAGGATPPNTEDYKNYGVNPWVETSADALSTFAIDVDTASYTIARRKLREGTLPPKDAVRPEEFLNFFDYKYDGPDKGPFKVHVGGAISPFNTKHHFLRVALQGKRLTEKERKVAHLTFLVDTSCSMTSSDKLALVKRSLTVLVENLRATDTVAVATYAGSTRKVLGPTPASNKQTILDAITRLRSGGGTAMASGMSLAYELASESFVKEHVNRVIVLSDGDANIGRTSYDEILKTIEDYVNKGITMSTIGFGMGNYKDTMMEQLANKGNGNYYYIDTIEQAERVFGKKMLGTLQVIAKDVKIQVAFNAELVERYRLIGYENRDIADKDFRNDKVDAGEIGAGHVVTALYEIKLRDSVPLSDGGAGLADSLATVRLRHKEPDASKDDKAQEQAVPVMATVLHREFSKADWATRWALAVGSFAEILRESIYAGGWTLKQVREMASKAAQADQPDHKEFLELLDRAIQLK